MCTPLSNPRPYPKTCAHLFLNHTPSSRSYTYHSLNPTPCPKICPHLFLNSLPCPKTCAHLFLTPKPCPRPTCMQHIDQGLCRQVSASSLALRGEPPGLNPTPCPKTYAHLFLNSIPSSKTCAHLLKKPRPYLRTTYM
jgi:hypothetical protein